jgi:hypothetical protein
VYLVVASIGIFSFGPAVRSSILLNYGELRDSNGEPMLATLAIQMAFIIVLVCHIPFIFYAGKEGMLILASEHWY